MLACFKKGALLLLFIWFSNALWADLTVAYVAGKAEFREETGTSWLELEEGQRVSEVGFVRIGSQGALELVKEGKARMLFSANTVAKVKLNLVPTKDRLLVSSGKILTELLGVGGSLQVRTPMANLGVRGTQFTVLTDKVNGTKVGVREGKVFTLSRSEDGSLAGKALVSAGQQATISRGGVPLTSPVTEKDAQYFDFSAYDGMKDGRIPTLFDHYIAEQDQFFRDFSERDLADYQLFVLEDLDEQWEYFLSENRALAEQLQNEPSRSRN